MHGPEAARILRDDFKYKGIILGKVEVAIG